jgi:predicted Zn-dependent protease
MTSRWSSEAERRATAGLALLLAGLALSGPAGAHPDLLQQIALLDRQIAQQPDDAALRVTRGDLHRRHGDLDAAEQDFAAARRIQPDFDTLDLQQARLLLDRGDAAGAERLLTRDLAAHPERAVAWSLRGRANIALRRPVPAAGDFEQAIHRSTAPSPALFRDQALALAAAGPEQWPAARRALDAALLRHPQDPALLGLASDVALAQGQPEAARALIGRVPEALHALPRWAVRLERAQCLERAGGGTDEEAARCLLAAREALDGQVGVWVDYWVAPSVGPGVEPGVARPAIAER